MLPYITVVVSRAVIIIIVIDFSSFYKTTCSSPPARVGTKSSTRDPVKIGESTLYECKKGKTN